MNIYVCADMEGIAGILLPEQLSREGSMYEEGRRLLTLEVNAVVEGLLEAGAERIIVRDMHGTGVNFVPELLHPGALYFMGGLTMDRRFPGLDGSFDGAMLIGYHAMAGTNGAIRDHTYSSRRIAAMELNGRPVGEIGIDSLLLGTLGVPVLLVAGDDKACAEAEAELGGGVKTYATKTAYGRHSALLKPPQLVRRELPAAIAESLRDAGRGGLKAGAGARTARHPLTPEPPYELTVRYMSTDMADSRYCDGTRLIRLDGTTVCARGTELGALLAAVL